MGNTYNSYLNLHMLPKQKVYSIIRSSLWKSPPVGWIATKNNPDYLFVRWRLLCFAPIEMPVLDSIDPYFFLILLKRLHLGWTDRLYKHFIDFDDYTLPDNIGKDAAFSLSILHRQFPGLYYGLNPYVETLLVRIGGRVLYEALGYEALDMSKSLDPELLQYFRADTINNEEFIEILQNYTFLKDQRMCIVFQSLFQCLEPFPNNSNLFKSDNFITLVNHCIIKRKKVFIDEIMHPCYNIIVEENDVNACDSFLSPFPELKALIPLVFFNSLNHDSSSFISIIDECVNTDSGVPIFNNVLKRFQNDSKLLIFLRNITGFSLARSDLSNMSIPYLLKQMLFYIDKETILLFKEQQFFMIDDKTRVSDFSFIFGLHCLSCVLEDIKEGKSTGKFKEYLSLIHSESIFVDLYSLIFLKENGKFICTPEIAKSILEETEKSKTEKEKEKVECALALGENSIDSCFMTQREQFSLLLDAKKYKEASEIFSENEELKEISKLAFAVQRMKKGKEIEFENNEIERKAATELFLSTEIGAPNENETGEIKTVINERLNRLDPLLIVDNSSIRSVLVTIDDGGMPDLTLYPLLHYFTEFENAAAKINFKGHSIIESVDEQIQKDNVDEWKSFEHIVGESSVEFLVKNSAMLGPNLRKMVCEKCPLLSPILEPFSNENTNKYYEKDIEELYKDLSVAFEEKNFDEIDDIFYQIDEEKFMEIAAKKIDEWKISEVFQILPFGTYRSTSLISNKKLTIKEEIEELFKQKQFFEAQIFVKEFKLQKELQSVLSNFVSTENFTHDSFIGLKCFFPKEAADLVDPNENKEEEEEIDIEKPKELFKSILDSEEEEKEKNKRIISMFDDFIISSSTMDFIINAIKSVIGTLSVKDSESEIYALATIKSIHRSLSHMKTTRISSDDIPMFENFFVKLDIAERFLRRECCLRFGTCYSLSSLFDVDFGLFILKMSIKYDFITLAYDTVNAYKLDTPLILSRAISCFNLGLYEDGLSELKRMMSTTKPHIIRSSQFLFDLKLSLIYRLPVDVKKCCENKEFTSPYKTISEIVEQQIGLIAGSPQISALNEAMIVAGMVRERVVFHASTGSFEEAFKAFRELGKTTTRFIKHILTPALSNMHWNVFWRYLDKNKEYLEEFLPLINETIQFLDNKRMFFTMLDISKRVGLNDEAIKASINIFRSSKSWLEMKNAANDMKIVAQQVICEANSSSFSQESIFALLHRIELQIVILDMFITENKPFDSNLELITSRTNAIKLGGELLVDWHLGFVNEICDFDDISLTNVCMKAVDILSKKEGVFMSKFIRNMRNIEDFNADQFIPCICYAFSLRIPSQKQFVQFVTANIPYPEFRALSYAKAGLKKEALEEAKKTKNNDFINRIKDLII